MNLLKVHISKIREYRSWHCCTKTKKKEKKNALVLQARQRNFERCL